MPFLAFTDDGYFDGLFYQATHLWPGGTEMGVVKKKATKVKAIKTVKVKGKDTKKKDKFEDVKLSALKDLQKFYECGQKEIAKAKTTGALETGEVNACFSTKTYDKIDKFDAEFDANGRF